MKLFNETYFEVGDRAAKEKIGQTFRDLLHTKYTSSTKAKAQVRFQKRMEEHRSESPANDSASQQAQSPDDNKEADDAKSQVSVVSLDAPQYPENDMPSHIGLTIETKAPQQEKQMSLFDSLSPILHFPTAATSSTDLEPLPLSDHLISPIEFNDSDVGESFDDELKDFLNEFHLGISA